MGLHCAKCSTFNFLLICLLYVSICKAWLNTVAPRRWSHSLPILTAKTNDGESRETSSAVSAGNSSSEGSSLGTVTAGEAKAKEEDVEDNDEEEEYEYIEYEDLAEDDFLGSEWLVGSNMNNDKDKITETWVRLAYDKEKNIAIWGDNAEGTWSFDVASQFLAVSKESIFGKKIWAGVVDDYYFLQGTVRGWTYISPAEVLGQWQAKRLGQDPDEYGVAPWFQTDEEGTQEEETKVESQEDENANS